MACWQLVCVARPLFADWHMRTTQAEVCVIETGLGGARDATNVFDASTLRCAVQTPIGMDHAAALGMCR